MRVSLSSVSMISINGALTDDDKRVMAVAYGKSPEALVLCGLVGIMDPPRQSAIQFVETMQVGTEGEMLVAL